MTCPHCDFENVDTRACCFRCGQAVDLSDVGVDPPRRRRGLPSRVHRLWNLTAARPDRSRGAPMLAVFVSLVPGLGHVLVVRATRRAAVVAGVWVAALVAAVAMDPPAGDWLARPHWLLTSTHVWIMTDAYQARLRHDGRRAAPFELYLVGLASVVMLSAAPLLGAAVEAGGWVMGYERMEITGHVEDPSVQQGDVVEIRTRDVPQDLRPGMVVTWPAYEGRDQLGTIRAVAGDDVQWQQSRDRLLVNGDIVDVPANVRAAWQNSPDRDFTLPADQVMIVRPYGSIESSLVNRHQVDGVVTRILDPAPRRRDLPS